MGSLALGFLLAGDAFAAGTVRWTGGTSTAWETAANWTVVSGTPSTPPASGDTVELGSGAITNQPTITTPTSIAALTYGNAAASTLTINGSLTISGNITNTIGTPARVHNINLASGITLSCASANLSPAVNNANMTITFNGGAFSCSGNFTAQPTNATTNINLTVGTGTFSVGGATLQGAATSQERNCTITVSTGTLTFSGAYTKDGNSSNLTSSGAANISFGGNVTNTRGAFNLAGSTTTFNGAAQLISGGTPTSGNVVVNNGSTVTLGVTASIASLTIGGGTSGTFTVGDSNTNRTLTVSGLIQINNGATMNTAGDGGSVLNAAGSLTNNGTFDMRIGAATMNTTFNGTANQTVSGTGGTTDFNLITVNNTGAVNSNIVEISSSSFSAPAAFLILDAGVLKMSGSFSFSNVFFGSANYTINSDEGMWINNANVTVTALNGDATVDGLLRISAGTYNIGTATNNDLLYNTGSFIDIQGGSLNIAGALRGDAAADTTTYNQSGGTVTVVTQGSSSSTVGSFDIRAAGSSFTMSAGTIVLQAATTTADDVQVNATTNNVTGGTLQVGNANTVAAELFVISSSAPFFNLTLNTTNSPTLRMDAALTVKGNVDIQAGAVLNANSLGLSIAGNWTKNGTFTPGTQTTTFNGSSNQSIGGASTTFSSLTINNSGAAGANIVSVGVDTSVAATLTISDGSLSLNATASLTANGAGGTTIASSGALFGPAGATGDFTLSAVTINSGGEWGVFGGTGPGASSVVITLSSTVTNNGLIHFDSNNTTCGDADRILIRSSVTGTQRTWSGTGQFRIQDVDVQDQNKSGTAITASSSTNSGNNTNWTIVNNCNAPTEVTLVSFTATKHESGVLLQWQTGYEVRNLGFNIFREQSGRRTRVTPSIVAGSALLVGSATKLTAGQSYAWFDSFISANAGSGVKGGVVQGGGTQESADGNDSGDAQYYLEDIDLNGKVTRHGPFLATQGAAPSPLAQSILLSNLKTDTPPLPQRQVTPVKSKSGGLIKPASITTQWDIAGKPAAKLLVKQDGWFRVSQADLAAAGIDVSRDPRLLQLFVDGSQVPIIVNGELDGHFDLADSVEFFGTAIDTQFTDSHVYWLLVGSANGLRINSVAGKGSPDSAAGFPCTIERKDRSTFFSALKNGDDDNWFGAIITSDPVNQSLFVQHLNASQDGASVEVALQGVTSVPGSTENHNVVVLLNGTQIGTIVYDGQIHTAASFPISASLVVEGANLVTLQSTAGDLDISLLDYVKLTYPHSYTADGDLLSFTAAGQSAVTVGGFSSSSVRVVDVTDPLAPISLDTSVVEQGSDFIATFASPAAGQRTLFAFADSQVKAPSSLFANQPSAWNKVNQGADLVIISHHDFISSLVPLRDLRRSQGYSVSLIDVEDLYDEFGYGHRSPQAVKDFLVRAKTAWKKAPRFVLLAGDGSNDPRNYLGLGDADLVPMKQVETADFETASDDWFVDFDLDGLPDLAIGRLPVRTALEAATVVSKITAYDKNGSAQGAVLVVDRNDEFDFEAANAAAKSQLPGGTLTVELLRSQMDDATMREAIIDSLNRGPKIVNYVGHGSNGLWRGNTFTSADAAVLSNTRSLSFALTMTCLNGMFQEAIGDSLAEALIKAPQGGAVAVWASSALTNPEGQSQIDQEAIRQVFLLGANKQRQTLGEATMRAKAVTADPDVRRSWILFGDPTTRLR